MITYLWYIINPLSAGCGEAGRRGARWHKVTFPSWHLKG